ncbi:hypothetical protein LINGRAHAP2_LOCUS14568 [Linum grandiflorum]
MGAQILVKFGCLKIGSGEDVRIWTDNWVLGLEEFQVHSYALLLDGNAKISSLIDQNSRAWN